MSEQEGEKLYRNRQPRKPRPPRDPRKSRRKRRYYGVSTTVTPLESAFIDQYLIKREITGATIESHKMAQRENEDEAKFKKRALMRGRFLLGRARVQAEYRRRLVQLSEEVHLDKKDVLLEDMRIGLANPKGIYDAKGNLLALNELPDEIAAAVAGYEVKERIIKATRLHDGTYEEEIERRYIYKFWNKGDSLQRLGEYAGAYKTKQAQVQVNLFIALSPEQEAETNLFLEWKTKREIEKARMLPCPQLNS
jgi:hypothetical protein